MVKKTDLDAGKMDLDYKNTLTFISPEEVNVLYPEAVRALKNLRERKTAGSEFLGWLDLPLRMGDVELLRMERTAVRLRKLAKITIVVGIGGSYLGAKAVIDMLSPNFGCEEEAEVIFAGYNLGEDYMYELLAYLENRDFNLCVISKSGTTTEPAVAFRFFRELLERKYSKKATEHIIAVTDEHKGMLHDMAVREGYETFVVPDDVGGRYSVLSAVGLLPVAVAGYDIREIVKGAADMRNDIFNGKNDAALKYACVRNALYRKGFCVEILANFHPKLHFLAEWWKQLFGESEGKEGKGIFPATADFTTDLHSIGQYIQEGRRMLMETVVSVEKTGCRLCIPFDTENADGLNYMGGKRVDEVNKMAELGTRIAHKEGGVPNMSIKMPALTPYHIGRLFYFFEIACGISGQLLGVNPFDQPGVEAYKKNMFALLGKPGYEEEGERLRKNAFYE